MSPGQCYGWQRRVRAAAAVSVVEPYAGSAAFSLRLHANVRPAHTYQGNKRVVAPQIIDALNLHGVMPANFVLNDANPSALVLDTVLDNAEGVARRVERMPRGRDGYDLVAAAPVPVDPVDFAAAWLVLCQGSALSKPPTVERGRWVVAGYVSNPLGRKGLQARRFEPASLARRVRALSAARDMPRDVSCVDAADLQPPLGSLVFCDPPYPGTTGYVSSTVVHEVVETARARQCVVVVCGHALSAPDALTVSLRGHAADLARKRRGGGQESILVYGVL